MTSLIKSLISLHVLVYKLYLNSQYSPDIETHAPPEARRQGLPNTPLGGQRGKWAMSGRGNREQFSKRRTLRLTGRHLRFILVFCRRRRQRIWIGEGFALDPNNLCAKRQRQENTYQRTRTPRSRPPIPPRNPSFHPHRTPPPSPPRLPRRPPPPSNRRHRLRRCPPPP